MGTWNTNTKFCLYVDDFGVNYTSKEDADNIIQALKEDYDITVDWKGEFFVI